MDLNLLAVAATFVLMAAVVVKRSVEDRRARRLGGGLIEVRLPGDGSRPDESARESGTRLTDAPRVMAAPRSAFMARKPGSGELRPLGRVRGVGLPQRRHGGP